MDLETYERLNDALLNEGSRQTIDQFKELLTMTLGEDTPLVQQLDNWESHNYDPGQLFNLKSVLRDKVTEAKPNFNTMESTGKLIVDHINKNDDNENRSLLDIAMDLFNLQRLDRWVVDYDKIYNRVVNTH